MHILSFLPAAFLWQTKEKNSFHAAAGMVGPRTLCLSSNAVLRISSASSHWPCSCRTSARLFMLLKVSGPRIRCKPSDFFGPSPQLLWIILWISGQKKVNAQIQEPDQDLLQPATAMAPSSFGKAPSDSQSEHVLGPLLSMDISKVCLLRSVAWTFL